MKANLINSINFRNVKPPPQKLKEACKEFESFFIYYILKTMRKTIPKTNLFGNGLSMNVYTSMLDEQFANKISDAGGIGLAKLLLREFEKNESLISSEHNVKVTDSIARKGGETK